MRRRELENIYIYVCILICFCFHSQPDVVPKVLADVKSMITPSKLIVSIAAGVTLKTLEEGRLNVFYICLLFFY